MSEIQINFLNQILLILVLLLLLLLLLKMANEQFKGLNNVVGRLGHAPLGIQFGIGHWT